MKELFSKLFLVAAMAGMVATPVASHAQTRSGSSPKYANSAALLQDEDDDDDEGGWRFRDGRTWSETEKVWIDANGDRWMLSGGKWYPLRHKIIPALLLAGFAAAFTIAVTGNDDGSDDNQSPGAN